MRRYVTDSPTFAQIKAYLQAGDAGGVADALAMFTEFEEKDADLASVVNTRRLALTGLDWDVSSVADDQEGAKDKKLADDAADYVRETLTNLSGDLFTGPDPDVVGFDEILEHLALAIGPGVSVAETLWAKDAPAGFVAVESHRLNQELSINANIRVITDDQPLGVDVAEHPYKFVVHRPHSVSGWLFKRVPARATAFVWVAKLLGLADWVTFCEIFGMPVRWGTYQPGATTEEKNELAEMLENMGTRAWAMFSQSVGLELKESSSRQAAPYKEFIEFCSKAMAKVYLGGNLTSDTTGGTGTYAAGAVQNEVRGDIRDDDIAKEARTVRRQIIAPMCRAHFGDDRFGPPPNSGPVPKFSRQKPEVKDRIQEATLLAMATQQIGLRVSVDHVHEVLEIPKPKEGDEIVQLLSDPYTEGMRTGQPGWPGMANGE